jgi:hypothetical protein
MQDDTQALIDRANSIVKKTGHGPGKRYPKKLKEIVSSLVNDHKLTTKQITNTIPVSQFSAREWPKKSKTQFKKVAIAPSKTAPSKKKTTPKKRAVEFQFIFLSLQSLMLALQIFLH